MLLDIDTELQHLISISVDKMTSETDSSFTERGSQKSGGMDLRKAVLVARFIQEVRQAYFEENYAIVLNTFSEMNYNENVGADNSCYYDLFTENPRHSQASSSLPVIKPLRDTVYPSCVTNSEVVVSKISQVTRPISVSVNTNNVMCYQSSTDQNDFKSKNDSDDDRPVFCDDLDVSSCCEVASCASDNHVAVNAEAESPDHVTVANGSAGRSGNETHAEDEVIAARESPRLTSSAADHTPKLVASLTLPDNSSLPKKKRPLPTEYRGFGKLPAVKAAKIGLLTDPCSHRSCEEQGFAKTACITSTTHTVILESRTSTSLSTVCSVIGRVPLNENYHPTPKVVVQLTQSCDSYLPITCTRMNKHLNNITAQAF